MKSSRTLHASTIIAAALLAGSPTAHARSLKSSGAFVLARSANAARAASLDPVPHRDEKLTIATAPPIGKYELNLRPVLNSVEYGAFPAVRIPTVDGVPVVNYVDTSSTRHLLPDDRRSLYTDLGNTQIPHGALVSPISTEEFKGVEDRSHNADGSQKLPIELNGWIAGRPWQSPIGRYGAFDIFYQQYFNQDLPGFEGGDFSRFFYKNDPRGASFGLDAALSRLEGDCVSYGYCDPNASGDRSTPWGWAWIDIEKGAGSNASQEAVNAYVYMQWRLNQLTRPRQPIFLMYQASIGLYGTWDRPARWSESEGARGFPKELDGVRLSAISPVMGFESYFFREDFFEQGTSVIERSGSPYLQKDRSPTVVDHFTSDGARHWADLAFGGLEESAKLSKGKPLALNLGLYTLAGGTGFQFNLNDETESARLSLTEKDSLTGSSPNTAHLPNYVPVDDRTHEIYSGFNQAIPRFAAEVLGVVPTFLGVKYVSVWQQPESLLKKAPVVKPADSPFAPEDRDRRVETYYHASKARMFNFSANVNGVDLTIGDLLKDPRTIYLRDQTEVSYLGFRDDDYFRATSAERKKNKLPYAYQIVNEPLKAIATVAFLPYGSQNAEVSTKIRVRYRNLVRDIELKPEELFISIDPIPEVNLRAVIAPNPIGDDGIGRVLFEAGASKDGTPFSYTITDLRGVTLYRSRAGETISGAGSGYQSTFDLSAAGAGVYVIRGELGGEPFSERFIKR